MKSFVCSLCHNGIVGGGLYLDSQSLTYKTNKLTVGKKYRNLHKLQDYVAVNSINQYHVNICRSPMAEFVMKDLVEKAGISAQFEIASAATSTEASACAA